jgi:hypothetical protein
VLERAVARALDGDELLRQRLLDLEGLVPDSRVWGRLGISELRGTATRLGGTRLWQAQLAHVLGRTVEPDLQVRYDRKVGWWDAALLAPLGITLDPDVGMPLQLTAGTTRRRQVAIYLDTSGSVDDDGRRGGRRHRRDRPRHHRPLAQLRPRGPPVRTRRPDRRRGGTTFEPSSPTSPRSTPSSTTRSTPCGAHRRLGPPVDPPDPQRWIWLILAHGDPWPRDHGMRTVVVPDLAGA